MLNSFVTSVGHSKNPESSKELHIISRGLYVKRVQTFHFIFLSWRGVMFFLINYYVVLRCPVLCCKLCCPVMCRNVSCFALSYKLCCPIMCRNASCFALCYNFRCPMMCRKVLCFALCCKLCCPMMSRDVSCFALFSICDVQFGSVVLCFVLFCWLVSCFSCRVVWQSTVSVLWPPEK